VLRVLNVAETAGRRVDAVATPDAFDRVRAAILRASRYVPGTRHCLTRALVAKLLLARQGHAAHIRIGVTTDADGRLTAHAWLEADGAPIFGVSDAEFRNYRLLPYIDGI
jgi:hypothetical protein